jgi:hypothetical protein
MQPLERSERRSRLGFAGEPVPCIQCDRREVGLAWGDYCTICRKARERRAGAVAQRVAIGGAAVLAAYLIWASPNELLPRIFAAASVLLAYVILRRLVARAVLDFFTPDKIRADRPTDERTKDES